MAQISTSDGLAVLLDWRFLFCWPYSDSDKFGTIAVISANVKWNSTGNVWHQRLLCQLLPYSVILYYTMDLT